MISRQEKGIMNANCNDIPKSRQFRFAQTPLALALRKVFSTSYLIKKRDSFAKDDWKIKEDLTSAKKNKLVEKMPPCETS